MNTGAAATVVAAAVVAGAAVVGAAEVLGVAENAATVVLTVLAPVAGEPFW